MSAAALELSAVEVVLSGRTVVDAVNLTLMPGEVLGLVGANGSGKTSLARAALGLLPLASGTARLFGLDPRRLSSSRRASLAALLPQHRSVGWNLPAWRVAALGAPLAPERHARARALAALAEVGAAALAERGVLDISGGERAKVLLARLMVAHAPLLVADEPEAGLDPDAQRMIMQRLADAARAGAAVLAILHDLTLAAAFCDRVAVLAASGRLLAVGPPKDAFAPEYLRAAFGLDGGLVDTAAGPVLAARRAAR